MWHLAAYSTSFNAATLTEINAVADGILQIQNNHVVPPDDWRVWWVEAFGTTMDRARLNSPFLRQTNPPWMRPIALTEIGVTNPNIALFLDRPLWVKGREEIAVEVVQSSGGAERENALIAFGQALQPTPQGNLITLRGTSTTAAVANTWSPVTITWEQALPVGSYAMILSEHVAANGQGHRWTFDGQYYRPGFPSFATIGLRHIDEFDTYKMGMMGRFKNDSMPRSEVLCNGADAVHTFYIDCIYLGP